MSLKFRKWLTTGTWALLLAAPLAEAAVTYAFTGDIFVAPQGPDTAVTTTVSFSFSMPDFFDPSLTRSNFTSSATKSFLVESVAFFESFTSPIDGLEYDMIRVVAFRPDKGGMADFLFSVGTFDAVGTSPTDGFPLGNLVVSGAPDDARGVPEPASLAILMAALGPLAL
jgi:hypothetical protein